ncbi:MAG TPA: hypothetical protein VGH71_08260 [Gammaproteobacteria bacterium]|jgi:hypothetical protein
MRFGNTFAKYRRGLIVAPLLTLCGDLALVFVAPSHQALANNRSLKDALIAAKGPA